MPIYVSSIYYYWTGPFANIGRFIHFNCNIYLKIQYSYFHVNLPAPGGQKSTFWHRKQGECASRVAFANMRGVQLSEAKVFTLEDNCGVFPWPDIILLLGKGRMKGTVPLWKPIPPTTFCSVATDWSFLIHWCYSHDAFQTEEAQRICGYPWRCKSGM